MKKLILLSAILGFAACSPMYTNVMTTTTYADVTIYDNSGNLMRSYPNAEIHTETVSLNTGNKLHDSGTFLKLGGALNFLDEHGQAHLVSGGIIFMDNISETKQEYHEKEDIIQSLSSEYKTLFEQNKEYKIKLKTIHDKGNSEYKKMSAQIKKNNSRMIQIATELNRMNVNTYSLRHPEEE